MLGLSLTFLLVFMALHRLGDGCTEKYIPHEVIASSNGEKTYREGGPRTLAIQTVQSGGCRTSLRSPTGTDQGAYTALTTGGGCSPPDEGKLTSFVGIVMQAKGWTLRPSEWIIRNIRKPQGTVVIFGMRRNRVIRPTLTLFTSSSLQVGEYEVNGGPSSVPGVSLRWNAAKCSNGSWRLCAVSASFSKLVDSVVVLFADDSGGSVQVGALYSKCGCRCRLVYEEKKHLAPVRTKHGTCWWGASSMQYHKCTEQGIDYCSVQEGVRFVADDVFGDERTKVPCSAEPYEFAVYEQPFVPHLVSSMWSPSI